MDEPLKLVTKSEARKQDLHDILQDAIERLPEMSALTMAWVENDLSVHTTWVADSRLEVIGLSDVIRDSVLRKMRGEDV